MRAESLSPRGRGHPSRNRFRQKTDCYLKIGTQVGQIASCY